MNLSHHRAASDPSSARPLLGVGLVLAAAALFAINGTTSKLVLTTGIDSLRLVEIRCLAAAAMFFAIAGVRRPASLAIGRRELGFVALYGVVGVAMVQWLYFVAIARMPVSISLLIEFTAPLLVALWVRFVRKDPVRPRIWVALVLVLGGLALVAQVWAGLTLDGVGLLCSALAACALVVYYLLGERGLGRRDPISLAAWSFGVAALFWALLLPWWTFPFERLTAVITVGQTGLRLPTGVLVIWVVLFGTVAPFGLVLAGLGRIGPTRTGLIGTTEPPLAGLVAWLTLGERLSAPQLAGAAVVLAGIVLAETARTPHSPMLPAITVDTADAANTPDTANTANTANTGSTRRPGDEPAVELPVGRT
ncbi:MAG TPA: EamA family transporter [Kineosporiaceae bacterium]|nr:EamA family transporter [Kineosporiaceae bacterium]